MLDFVVCWVDGNDPKLIEKKKPYLSPEAAQRNDIAGPARFCQNGELFYCIASILRFASDVAHKIYIVTDNQDPHLEPFLAQHFPHNSIPIELINQQTLFEGYEQYLPVFNSIAIETMLYRIPGLSDNFVYMNDDFMFVRPVSEQDFVCDGKPVAYARPYPKCLVQLRRLFRPKRGGGRTLSHKETMVKAADILQKPYFQRVTHTPYPLSRTWFEHYFAAHPEVMEANISHRFRHADQVNVQSLFYTDAIAKGLCVARNPRKYECFVRGKKKPTYLPTKLKRIETTPTIKFACFNGVYQFNELQMNTYKQWTERLLGLG